MKYDWEFSERIHCSEAEKKECMALVASVVAMAIKAKRNGLLSLVQEAEETPHFLLRKGLQLILEGVNPPIIKELLLSLFGEDSYKVYESEYGDEKIDRLKAFFKKIRKSRATTPLSAKLGDTILQLDDSSIQQCLKEISTVDLARALKGIEGKAQIKVFKNLPKRSAAILQETVEHLDLMRESEETEAQEKMLMVIADVEKQDEFISPN